jgi:hypothetical protein
MDPVQEKSPNLVPLSQHPLRITLSIDSLVTSAVTLGYARAVKGCMRPNFDFLCGALRNPLRPCGYSERLG